VRPSKAGAGLVGLCAGVVLSLLVNGGFYVAAVKWGAQGATLGKTSGTSVGVGTVRRGLCGKKRCSEPESRVKRRGMEEAPVEAINMVAELVPALGLKQRDPRKLPELQTYREKEVVKSGINLRKKPKRRDKLKKDWQENEPPESLEDAVDHVEEDERRRQTDKADLVGVEHGEIGGAELERRGDRYLGKIRRLLSRLFRSPNLSDDILERVYVRIKIVQMRADGAILKYRVLGCGSADCQNAAFNSAAIQVIERFVKPRKGEPEKTLPRPEPEVLRLFNTKGLKIRLQGRDHI
jgi:hypothetical protein